MVYEADHAEAVVARLRADGFDAGVARERFAGEDDDEDHPWILLTDAPEFVLEVLVEQYDGWVEPLDDTPAASDVPPLELPDAPRRVKAHFTPTTRRTGGAGPAGAP